MKKIAALLLVFVMIFAFASCNKDKGGDETPKNEFDPAKKSEGVMTYDEYAAAALDAEVVIEGYVQAKQSWWNDKATIYLQDPNGGYYVYEMICTEEQYNKLTVGTKIKVTGYKTEYHGEIEVDAGSTFEIVTDGTWVATPTDLTSLLGNEAELLKKQNILASFKGMTVKSVSYKGGEPGDDIYLTLTYNGADYNFCVERYLTAPDTAVYQTVGTLKAGDVIDVEGFLYWYDGINTHITNVVIK